MPGSFRLGKIADIEIAVQVSWLLIVVLLTWSLATGWFPALYKGKSAPPLTVSVWSMAALLLSTPGRVASNVN